MDFTVAQLSKLAGVSIRTLHYYDEIGLLKPSIIKQNGYRSYGKKELLTLQQILFFKELDFSLDDIRKMIHASSFTMEEALNDQKNLLLLKKKRLEQLVTTIEVILKKLKGGEDMNTDDLYASFDDEEIEQYKEEAKQRWGHTEAYQQSVESTKHWTKDDYKRIKEEGIVFTKQLSDAMEKGIQDPEVQRLIALHHKSIGTFYECSLEMYRNLGEMYVADPRFTAYYEKFKPGLAVQMRNAITFYCDTHEKKS